MHSIIDPAKVPSLVAGALGAFLSLLFQRDASRLAIITTISSAEIVDYYFAQPLFDVCHANFSWCGPNWAGPLAFTLGLTAIFIVGGFMRMVSQFADSPWKTFASFAVSILKGLIPGRKEE